MNDHFSDESEEESFAELLDAYDKGMDENLQVGDKVKGTIISIGKGHGFYRHRNKSGRCGRQKRAS
jgi:small subunit ribosomal protein S1